MKQQLEQYTTLRNQTLNQLDKAYKKLNDQELEDTIKSIHLKASEETKQIILALDQINGLNEEAKETIGDLKDLLEGELEFVFEDSEFHFVSLNTIANS